MDGQDRGWVEAEVSHGAGGEGGGEMHTGQGPDQAGGEHPCGAWVMRRVLLIGSRDSSSSRCDECAS